MLRDVFYYGKKPNVHPREKFATDLADARRQCTTEHFWIINEYCDYRGFDWDFDFEFLPDEDVWAEQHNNVWPSQHQKDSGTWLCSSEHSDIIVYRADVNPLKRKNEITEFWILNDIVDLDKFDFSWHPDPTDPPYIYIWGNKHIPGEVRATLEYHAPGATSKKYMGIVEVLPEVDKWKVYSNIDISKFDMSWRPDPTSPPYIYVWGNKWVSGNIAPTVEYHCEGATARKFMTNDVVLFPENDKWIILETIDTGSFDLTWRPDPTSPPYIYVWGNKWVSGEIQSTLEYHVPGATQKKYVDNTVILLPDDNWEIYQKIDTTFDLTWRPDPTSPPYIYVWGNKYVPGEIESTLEYKVPGATEKKYMGEVDVLPEWDKWKICIPVDKSSFDFSWRPDPREPAYIYVWGNQHNSAEKEATVEYYCEGATERKYMHDAIAQVLPIDEAWNILIPVENFDFSWRPDPHSPPYVYVFGNQWHEATIEPTLEYTVPGATSKKYISSIVAHTSPDIQNWKSPGIIEGFDYTWRPNPLAPPMIYQFGTVLEDIHLKDGPVYSAPGNDGTIVYLENSVANKQKISYPKYYIKTTLDALIEEHPDEIFWALRDNINYDKFDFTWAPTKENVFHINVFGSADSETTQTYFVNTRMISSGYKQLNFVENRALDDEYLSTLFKPMDMFFVDRSNKESSERFAKLKEKFPNIQKTRFLNTWVDTVNRCLNKCSTELCWILNSELDYDNFDFEYYPNPWQMKMVHVFGTQWNHWGTTFVVNKESFPEDTKYIKVIEHLSNINFVKKTKAKATSCLYDIYFIDHGNDESSEMLKKLQEPGNTVYEVKYQTDYLQTFKNLIEEMPIRKDHYVWVCSSIVKYDNFDFTYICDPFSLEQLHVFPSDRQKYGDTFFVNVNKLRTLIDDLSKLDDLEKINFNNAQRTTRLPCPTIITDGDTHTDFAKFEHNFPYAVYLTEDNKTMMVKDEEPMSLWSLEDKNIIVTSDGASRVVIPQEAKNYVKKELYDYPYIVTANRVRQSRPLDIVFLSNGETGADENYEHLLKVTKGLPNRVVRVDGVNGRVAAYHASAEASETPWLFTVFAKLKVNEKFNWSWQPDRLQIPKHYIFNATNPVNGLVYGHQAMIAYNKKITLANSGRGLDFTLDDAHEVVDMNSGVAKYNTDEWSTWRTAFREVIKLKKENSETSLKRLEAWMTKAEGNFAQYSIDGALDGIAYFEEVDGKTDKLRLSYEWTWLRERFDRKYK